MTPEPITIDGSSGLVTYLNDDWALVPKEKATLARVIFKDGHSAFYTISQKRSAMADEGPLHAAADANENAFYVAIAAAFSVAQRELKRLVPGKPARLEIEPALAALRRALGQTLPGLLLKTLVAGGEVATGELKALGDVEGHPFHGNQWTTGTESVEGIKSAGIGIDSSNSSYLVRNQLQYPINRDYHAPNSVFRGITTEEAQSIMEKGEIQSTLAYSHASEGTSYGASLAESESIINVGRDNPHLTNKSTFVVQVSRGVEHVEDKRDYVIKSNKPIPKSRIEHVWRFDPTGKVSVHKSIEDALNKLRSAAQESDLRTAKRTDKKTKIDFAFDAENQDAIDWADRHAAELIDGITETSREAINNAIADLLESGDWKDAIDEILNAVGDKDRARRIARNETMTAVSEGQRQSWNQAVKAGYLSGDEKRTWITVGDDKVCPICEPLDGAVADLDGQYPGEGGDGPPAHVLCRCTEGLIS